MANTIPNIKIKPNTITDIYLDPITVAAGITIGTAITVSMIGAGEARLWSGATAPAIINDDSGYLELATGETSTNEAADLGGFIWSLDGCTVNIKAA